MNALQDDPGADLAQIAPVLDEAIMSLGTEDRTAIMLCFFERRDFRSIGQALGSSEDAARMRVTRALDKLHTLLTHRGVTLSVAALGTALATEAVTAAPAGLAGSVAGAALTSAAAGSGVILTVLRAVNTVPVKVTVVALAGVALLATAVHYFQAHKSLHAENLSNPEATTGGPGVLGANNTALKLSGNFENAIYQGDPKPKTSGTYKFEVIIAGSSWVINYESVKWEHNDPFFAKFGRGAKEEGTASCDGTNIYLVTMQSEVNAKEAWGDQYESMKDDLPAALATIYPGVYPPPVNCFLQPIWLAFASSSVLREPGGRAKPPFSYDLATFYNTNCYCDYYWATNAAFPEARALIFKDDGHVFEKDHSRNRMIVGRYAAPYDKGFIGGRGVWSGGTNFAGKFVWRRFELTTFSPKFSPKGPGKSSTDLLVSSTERCVITDVSTVAPPPIPPQLPVGKVCVTDVSDGRFERLESRFSYVTSNGWRR
jgi:hypothetical protein